eukprot:9183002-Pyramimonas_sp.AAC.1
MVRAKGLSFTLLYECSRGKAEELGVGCRTLEVEVSERCCVPICSVFPHRLCALPKAAASRAFLSRLRNARSRPRNVVTKCEVGLLYATATGSTREVAKAIKEYFPTQVVSDPIDVSQGGFSPDSLKRFSDGLIIGAPTWATARDDMRSGTCMDDLLWR